MVEKPNEVDQEIGGTEPASVDGERGSAPGPDRPELRRLISAASNGQIDAVVVCDHSSLSKDPPALAKTLGELDRLGVAVLTVEQFPPKDEVPG